MKVIGAGLPRTGTLSQKIALEQVGIGPCYHMVNVLANLDLAHQWRRALDGDANWDEVFDGFEATVDWPGSFFYRELIDVYPEAKVILTIRDGDSWEFRAEAEKATIAKPGYPECVAMLVQIGDHLSKQYDLA